MGDSFDGSDDEDIDDAVVVDFGDARQGANGIGQRTGAGEGPGLSPFERSVVDRVERDRDTAAGRAEFGRYAESHPSALPEGSGGGRGSDGDEVDAIFDAAQRFEPLHDGPSELERSRIAAVVTSGQNKSLRRIKPNPKIAEFTATIPDGGIKTNRTNEWVLTLNIAWENREDIARLIDTIPMQLKCKFERVADDE